eukprot:Transcript_26603.p1 GENE.Transcript_26603~~Transcript_26603.p1  ORF type:complete len:529 (-),score=185.38 Transcript_26603:1381-2967(-)
MLASILSVTVLGNALDGYVGKQDPNFKWHDTNVVVKFPLLRAEAHILNVTSQQWLTTAQAVGPNGALWTHQVAVVLPKTRAANGTAVAVMTGGCNEGPPKPPPHDDEYLLLAATVADLTGAVAIVIYQIPNCHIVYPSDPSRKARSEDAMIAWAWRQFVEDPTHDPRWLPRLPMVKAGFACMLAAEQFVAGRATAVEGADAPIDGWVVSGASKRGWTSWMVGAVAAGGTCDWCPKVVGLVPLVPIVPFLNHSVHLQRRSLGGFTFAFIDYLQAGVLKSFDTPTFQQALAIIDPSYYAFRLGSLPKLSVVSSDDEFMQLDWTQHGWATLPGETHLLVAPNSEHSLASAVPEVVESIAAFVASLAAGEPAAARPRFSFARDNSTGGLTVQVPAGAARPSKARLRFAETISTTRRDFRWVRAANASLPGDECELPDVPLEKPVFGGGNCLQPIVWEAEELKPTSAPDGGLTYAANPKPPKPGHWRGYYIELSYPSVQHPKLHTQVSTPGFVWPDTLPFEDCNLAECSPRLV